MKLTTSKNLEYNVKWAGVSSVRSRQMLIKMDESKPFVTLLSEFDGLDWAETSGPSGQPNRRIEGKMRLVSASKIDNGDILIVLEKEDGGALSVEVLGEKEGAN